MQHARVGSVVQIPDPKSHWHRSYEKLSCSGSLRTPIDLRRTFTRTAASQMRIASVVVTFNRSRILAESLRALLAQTRLPDHVMVVDNGCSDDTRAMLARDFPTIEVASTGDNLGYGAGLAVGMRALQGRGIDAYWLMDDDSRPEAGALKELLRALEAAPAAAVVALRGGLLGGGVIRHKDPHAVARRPSLGPGVHSVDFVMIDGALILQRVVDAVGYPREDLFMMMEDIEYGLRITRSGLAAGVLARDLMQRSNLGQHSGSSGAPLWRRYYKTRNHVRIALESRSPVLIAGCAVRQLRFIIAAAVAGRQRAARMHAILTGLRDGVLGRMGRTREPSGD
jgi:GT2 family glycosyltransferase